MVKMEEGSTDGFDQNRDLEIFPGTNAEFSIRSEGNAGRLLESIAPITETRTIGLSMDYHGRTGSLVRFSGRRDVSGEYRSLPERQSFWNSDIDSGRYGIQFCCEQ